MGTEKIEGQTQTHTLSNSKLSNKIYLVLARVEVNRDVL
jgi:hypothetical protein